ncbi:bidirectional sugar transporter SWEET14 [Cinnamomum micranthum f. kanehirae]|uniref:Bidirectional sugar transporter SWEET n=1 Tax=Cinnamomum micranthum f. kanehirae TaxID=337451 RepID=A0A3S3PMT5_9MAGN|nr:bidirectional sugar transporter SWEET14 [Cinnamomum micranthum f. kanehirae]
MATNDIRQSWGFAAGVVGNVVSFMVYLAPLPTFYRVYKKKSTEGFQSIPYVVALFSAMLWLYYGMLKTDGYLLITSNSVGCAIEAAYITVYMVYATRSSKIFTVKLLLLMNVGAFGLILLFTFLLVHGAKRLMILGWIGSAFSRLVIRTKSVEFMPIRLSFFLTISALIWFAYGFLIGDYFVALPNVLGLLFGVTQMILYIVYRGTNKPTLDEQLPERVTDTRLSTLDNPEVHPMDTEMAHGESNESPNDNQTAHGESNESHV